MEHLNGQLIDYEKTMRSFKRLDCGILLGMWVYNLIHKHMRLGNRAPAQMARIVVRGIRGCRTLGTERGPWPHIGPHGQHTLRDDMRQPVKGKRTVPPSPTSFASRHRKSWARMCATTACRFIVPKGIAIACRRTASDRPNTIIFAWGMVTGRGRPSRVDQDLIYIFLIFGMITTNRIFIWHF